MRVLGIVASMAVLISAQAVHAQSPAVTDLPRAKTCSVRSTLAVAGGSTGNSQITMSGDGGWCWFNLTATNGSLQFVPTYRVAMAPAHGELAMGAVGQRARIAYRPVPGYTGDDTYTLANTVTNSERKVTVTVTR
jgi:hypothetical protein